MPELWSGKLIIRVPDRHVAALRASPLVPSILIEVVGPGHIEPLFRKSLLGLVGGSTDWLLYEPPSSELASDITNPWDHAYIHAMSMNLGLNGLRATPNVYVEPDLLIEREFATRESVGDNQATPHDMDLTSDEPTGPPYAPKGGLIRGYPPSAAQSFSPAWYLDQNNFKTAWQRSKGKGIRVGHLDIGYWPPHYSTPENISKSGYNFCEENTDVVDPGNGLNAGHGTATLALLAGKKVSLIIGDGFPATSSTYEGYIGCAPEVEILPVRIAGVRGSVIYWHGHMMARGLSYAISPSDGKQCDVVSLSHGGLPLKCWAIAVNALYNAGTVVVAAAGDSYYAVVTDIATHFTVYPSAFYRVVTATGVTYDGGPYKRNKIGLMQGCWGPDAVMEKAVAAPTPNIPWMSYHTCHGWDMNGAGTSASTPQVAAACALWLAVYGSQFPKGWERVEACRAALIKTVAEPKKNFREIGMGRLNMSSMLDQNVVIEIKKLIGQKKLKPLDADDVNSPFFRLLFGLPPPGRGVEEMYEVEASQLLYRAKERYYVTPKRKLLEAKNSVLPNGTYCVKNSCNNL